MDVRRAFRRNIAYYEAIVGDNMSLLYKTYTGDIVTLEDMISMYPDEWNAAVVDICSWVAATDVHLWHVIDYILEITDVFEEIICGVEIDNQLKKYDTESMSDEGIEDLIDSFSISHYLSGEIDHHDIIMAFSHIDIL